MSDPGRTVRTVEDAMAACDEIGFPCVIRPSFTLHGAGAGTALDRASFLEMARAALNLSPVHEIHVSKADAP